MQAVIQKWNDSAISKTVNAPSTYTPEDVAELYMYGYDKGLKGITVYVDGSRTGVLNYIEEKKEEPKKNDKFAKRPQVLEGKTFKTQTPFGKGYVTINDNDNGDIDELFIKLGKTGADIGVIADALAIALTGALSPRLANLSPQDKLAWITKKFRRMSGATSIGFGPNRVDSLPDAIAKVLESYEQQKKGVSEDVQEIPKETVQEAPKTESNADLCPECGAAALVREEGCYHCKACSFSKCS
jgi:ribonucleoside-diphosphate reductase alpha chain